MKYDPERHHRQSIRLRGYDCRRDGIYFVTLCVLGRTCLFGDIVNGQMRLNEVGSIVDERWRWRAQKYGYVELGAWVVMPNHFHGLLILRNPGPVNAALRNQMPPANNPPAATAAQGGWQAQDGSRTAPTESRHRKPLGQLIGAFKTVSTKHVNLALNLQGTPLWQRNFYDRIVRTDRELQVFENYINRNPTTWAEDQLHPANPSKW